MQLELDGERAKVVGLLGKGKQAKKELANCRTNTLALETDIEKTPGGLHNPPSPPRNPP